MNETTTRTEPSLVEQWRAGEPPSPPIFIVAIAFLAILAIIVGCISVLAWANNQTSSGEASFGIAAFGAGWFFVGFAFALRKLQLIEWRLQRPAERPVHAESWAARSSVERVAKPGALFD